jgi:hypothetical protein
MAGTAMIHILTNQVDAQAMFTPAATVTWLATNDQRCKGGALVEINAYVEHGNGGTLTTYGQMRLGAPALVIVPDSGFPQDYARLCAMGTDETDWDYLLLERDGSHVCMDGMLGTQTPDAGSLIYPLLAPR